MSTHFTPYPLKPDAASNVVHVPGHSLGGGYTRHIVELAEGDTAVNPGSTKPERVLRGPGVVVYDLHRTGTTATEYDNAGQFYDDLAKSRAVLERLRRKPSLEQFAADMDRADEAMQDALKSLPAEASNLAATIVVSTQREVRSTTVMAHGMVAEAERKG